MNCGHIDKGFGVKASVHDEFSTRECGYRVLPFMRWGLPTPASFGLGKLFYNSEYLIFR